MQKLAPVQTDCSFSGCFLLVSGRCSCVFRYIIGKKGETRKRLESDTKTSISIPKQGVEGQIGKRR